MARAVIRASIRSLAL